ncbi:HAD-IIIC family phosphatase [soil metagenome]
MQTFNQLKKNLKNDYSGFKKIKIAVLGDSATQFLSQAIRGSGYDLGLNQEIFEADFNQIERQIFDPTSELYSFTPDIILIFYSSHKLLAQYNKLPLADAERIAEEQMDLIEKITEALWLQTTAKILYYNYNEIDDGVFGNYAGKVPSSFLFQLRKLNYELMLFASRHANFFIVDISSIQNQFGKHTFFQSSVYINTEMVLSIDILPVVAAKTTRLINSLSGNFKKCLILDLDNTLWGGIIGDDGIENIQLGSLGIGKAFTEFQYWIKKLQRRGIILAVCSKNTESVAKEPFEKHPDMVLKLSDIAVFVANWENKADNIKQIQTILNIGFDSIVFLDDNPFERNMVRDNITGITVPELPEDPAEYLEFLYTLDLFETTSFSSGDAERTRQYQVEAERTVMQKTFTNETDFLKNLDMVSDVEPFNKFNTPRVAQLSQRSNQFNLRTVRYTESDIERIISDPDSFSFTFTLEDRFGDNGMICVIVLKWENANTLFIETWLMSCRVLKRGMEQFVLNSIVNFAKKEKCSFLKGEYIETAKNEMVKNHYPALGFEASGNYWLLNVDSYNTRECFIKNK